MKGDTAWLLSPIRLHLDRSVTRVAVVGECAEATVHSLGLLSNSRWPSHRPI
jgi:hypothetical protein